MDRDDVVYEHKEYASGLWRKLSLCQQMGNIGSEVSRAFKWKDKNPARASRAADRALELFELSIDAHKDEPARLHEILLARDEFCDVFYGFGNYPSTPAQIQKYYDDFVLCL